MSATTDTAQTIHIMRIGHGQKLHIQRWYGERGTRCGIGTGVRTGYANRNAVIASPRIDLRHGQFAHTTDAAAWLTANAPRNACASCLRSVLHTREVSA